MSLKNLTQTLLVLLALVFLVPSPAYANVGLPVLFWSLPLMVLSLIPVIAIESYMLWAWLGTSAAYSVLVVAAANVASTIVGVPLSWIFVIPLGILPGMAPAIKALWDLEEESFFRVTIGFCSLLAVCFFLSWFIEGWVAELFLGRFSSRQVDEAIFMGNIVTYSMLVAFVVGLAILGWLDNRRSEPYQTREPEMALTSEMPESDEWVESNELEESEKIHLQTNGIQVLSLAPSEAENGVPEQVNGNRNGHLVRERESPEVMVDLSSEK